MEKNSKIFVKLNNKIMNIVYILRVVKCSFLLINSGWNFKYMFVILEIKKIFEKNIVF